MNISPVCESETIQRQSTLDCSKIAVLPEAAKRVHVPIPICLHQTVTSPTPPLKRYFLAVDGFRLIASLNVVLFHLSCIGGMWELRGKPQWLFHIIEGPALHASVFFLLGGFIFTVKYSAKAASFSTSSFLRQRFSELFPLHLVTTLIMAAVQLINSFSAGHTDLPKLLVSVFMHLTFLWSVFPFGTFPLNRPSWALGAFFLCYALFGFALKRVVSVKSRTACAGWSFLIMLPLLLWTLIFKWIGMPENLYHFFHTFAPIRFFEFLLGMMLARYFLLSPVARTSFKTALVNDCLIAVSGFIIYLLMLFRKDANGFVYYLNYHVTLIPLYFTILYALALERGIFAWLLSLPVIRKTGKGSFYPYLLHIPLFSGIALVMEKIFYRNDFLHHTINIITTLVLLYGGAYVFVNHLRRRSHSQSNVK